MTDSSNEVDGVSASQPRSFSATKNRPSSGRLFRTSDTAWIIAVPVFVLTILAAAFLASSEVKQAPPVLQSFSRPTTNSLPPRITLPAPTPKIREPIIRVNVTPGGTDSFQLELRSSHEFRSLDPKRALSGKIEAGKYTVASTTKGLKLGSRQITADQIELIVEKSPAVRINGHLYRGQMRLFRRTDGKVSAVNVLPIEEYLASVVDSEMPTKFPEAARRSQAIVARTYALYQIEHADPKAVFDLLASQRSQKYLGVEYLDAKGRRLAGESASSRSASASTRGIVCQQNGKLFCTYYSAVCGGRTTDGQAVFKDAASILRSVPCEWCRASPHFRWKTEMPQDDFRERAFAQSAKIKKPTIRSVSQKSGPGDGTVSRFEFDDGKQPISLTGIELRERLPTGVLSSPHFEINFEQDRVIFDGRGHGHGVGFCQWGAKGQAEAGRNHLEIIRHYYPGVEIATLNY